MLYRETAGRQLAAELCPRSAAAGVRPGMTVAHARALLPAEPEPLLRLHDATRDHTRLESLARWAIRFSPIVAADPPDGLLLDVDGCDHLFGGLPAMVAGVARSVRALGFHTRAAAAPSFACARALARYGEDAVVEPRHVRDATAALPVEALRIESGVVDALHEVGIDRIGHLYDIPRQSLGLRFGPGLVRVLDEMLGEAPETIDPVRPVTPPVVERVFAGPVKQLEAIMLTVDELAAELSQGLEQRESGARRIVLCLERLDATPVTATLSLSHPSREPRHLRTLLRPKVESMNLGFGVERVTLTATRLGRLAHEQVQAWAPDDRDRRTLQRDFGELVDTMRNRLGVERVVHLEPVRTHIPERAYKPRAEPSPASPTPPTPPTPDPGRPTMLFEGPDPIHVIALTPDGPPSWLRWRGVELRVTASEGPERIAPEWWRRVLGESHAHRPQPWFGESYARAYARFLLGDGREDEAHYPKPPRARVTEQGVPEPTRDYFRVRDELGRWLWIYHEIETGRWFLHGLWG